MKTFRALICPLLALAVSAPALAVPVTVPLSNVALHGVVSIDGAGFSNKTPAATLASVTDGRFLSDGTQWHTGTLNWMLANPVGTTFGADLRDVVTITLAKEALVSSLTLQSDNKDVYAIDYLDVHHQWKSLTTISTVATSRAVGGMSTGVQGLVTPVWADAFRIRASGDGLYAISEFQALGRTAAVPEPESYAMLLAGLGMLGFIAHRRRQSRVGAKG